MREIDKSDILVFFQTMLGTDIHGVYQKLLQKYEYFDVDLLIQDFYIASIITANERNAVQAEKTKINKKIVCFFVTLAIHF